MPDGRSKNGGARTGAGSPGYGKLEFIKRKVTQHSELWWQEWEIMMQGAWEQKKEAMREFNKLQAKMIPQDVTSGGKELPQPILYGLHGDNCNKEDNEVKE